MHKKILVGIWRENVKTTNVARVWSPWHITTSSHCVCVLTWPQPSNHILPSGTQGNIRIAYAFGRSPHPHSSAMCSQASSLPPLSLSLPLRSDSKSLAHIAVHCNEMQTLNLSPPCETYSVPLLELSWAFQGLLKMQAAKLSSVLHAVSGMGFISSRWYLFHRHFL